MRYIAVRALLWGLGMLAWLAAGTAVAADWTLLGAPPGRADFDASAALPREDGFDLLGGGGGIGAIAHYDAAGALKSAQYADVPLVYALTRGGLIDAAPAANGGAFVLYYGQNAFGDPLCSALALDAGGSQRWGNVGYWGPDCHVLGTDTAGGFWLESGLVVQHVAADGTAGAQGTLHGNASSPAPGAVDAASGTLYVADVDSASGNTAIVALGTDGALRPVWQTQDHTLELSRLTFGSDGNLYALGGDTQGIVALSLTRDGTARWTKSVPGGELLAGATAADGTQYTLDRAYRISVLAPDGTLRAQQTLILGACDSTLGCAGDAALLAPAPGGEILVLLERAPELVRLDAQAKELARTPLHAAVSGNVRLNALADGSALVGALAATSGAPGTYARVRHDGSRADPALAAILAQAEQVHVSAADAGGAVYVLSGAPSAQPPSQPPQRSWLSKITPDGQLAWRQEMSGSSDGQALQLGAERACFTLYVDSNIVLQCRAAADGHLLWQRATQFEQAFGVLADGSVMQFVADTSGATRLQVIAPDGTLQRDVALAYSFGSYIDTFAIAPDGTAIVSSLTHNGAVFAWDRNGDLRYSASAPVAGSIDGPIEIEADGSAVLLPQTTQPYLWRIAADGHTLWTSTSLNYVANIGGLVGDTVYALDYVSGPNYTEVLRFNAATGALQATVPLPAAPSMIRLPDFDRASGLVLSHQPLTGPLSEVSLYDTGDGHLVRTIVQDCAGHACSFLHFGSASLGADGTLRIVSDQPGGSTGETFRVDAYRNVAAPPAAARVDQAGIDGAWYAPYATGQGFTLDYIASANLVFMPWFTFDTDGLPTPAGLRWFTLQGNVAAGAREVDLVLAASTPGTFNSGTTTVQMVGSATLRFTDCDSALLVYDFGAGLPGNHFGSVIALSRLTPSTTGCELADGSQRAPAIANAPAQGFDARQSGSWYDPAKSGQGLELSVIPAGNGFAGLVFGAWFTFDPAGKADDTAQQHWFTLQGDLSAAANGAVVLPILRTLGGSLYGTATHDTLQVGQATLTFTACDRARLDFRFDNDEVAHAFAGIAGSTDLVRIGGCAP